MNKVKVVIAQLGSPKSTKTSDVREYLREFLSDKRVIDINPFIWKIILNLFILPFRPKKSAQAYARIQEGNTFPLIENTKKFAEKLSPKLDKNIELNYCFLLSQPRVGDVLDQWESEGDKRADELFILPQFPQYSESTIASVVDALGKDVSKRVNLPSITVINAYHKSKAFIDNSLTQIKSFLAQHKDVKVLIISFHGIPLRRVLYKKDRYYQDCVETFLLIKNKLNLDIPVEICFQSRFGSEQWLGPSAEEKVDFCINNKWDNIAVYCPSFVVDCLETTDEIGNELAHHAKDQNAKLQLVPCLNDNEQWASDYANFINISINGNRTDKENLFYVVDPEDLKMNTPKQEMKSPPLSDHAKSTIKILFLTLFLDLVGFSIIFPIFPALAKHYLEVDGNNYFLNLIFDSIKLFVGMSGASNISSIVLFGGALGALYSLLQFIFAPIWGSLSDKYGRKPILVISIFGLFISYVLWIFSGSFTLLIIARIIGGVMGGNISAATAAIADVTEDKNRAKGMAFVGIAFALGFIIGPALGGILSMVDLRIYFPSFVAFGLNPFSSPALLAAILAFINLFYVVFKFEETLKEDARGKSTLNRSANPLKLFKALPFKGVNLTNWAYFIFISAFSGMEFTLTFLAAERLGFSSLDNGMMFIFIGFIIAFVQGGYVRRKANSIGEDKMAIQGLITVIPGLLLIAFSQVTWVFYAGLFFLAAGSAMSIPTLTSLVSIYSPKEDQGVVLGVFRSLGALGRVIGPIFASIVYWKWGTHNPYILGSIIMIIPLMMIKKLRNVERIYSE